MNRRELLVGGGTMLATAAFQAATASAEGTASAGAGQAHGSFAQAADKCVSVGTQCLEHCLTLLGQGDKSLGGCAQAVNEMLAVCRVVGPLAAADSTHLKALARLCADVCTDCEKACRPHADHHPVCKACAEACTAVIAEAKKVAA
jgi:Cys-rich four helix bundle protein (predicted Tat secretion target)